MVGEHLFDNLLTVAILVILALIVYLRISKRSLLDFFRDVREITREEELHE